MGLVNDIGYNDKGEVVKIYVKFDDLDHLEGKEILNEKIDHRGIPIKKISVDFEVSKDSFVQRTQFPLELGFAMTIHRAQVSIFFFFTLLIHLYNLKYNWVLMLTFLLIYIINY